MVIQMILYLFGAVKGLEMTPSYNVSDYKDLNEE